MLIFFDAFLCHEQTIDFKMFSMRTNTDCSNISRFAFRALYKNTTVIPSNIPGHKNKARDSDETAVFCVIDREDREFD